MRKAAECKKASCGFYRFPVFRKLPVHRIEELLVGLGLGQVFQQELHAVGGVHAEELLAQQLGLVTVVI